MTGAKKKVVKSTKRSRTAMGVIMENSLHYLGPLLAEAMVEWLLDPKGIPAPRKSKGDSMASFRATCAPFRDAIDPLIEELMSKIVSRIIACREKHYKLHSIRRPGQGVTDETSAEYLASREACAKADANLNELTTPCFGKTLADQIRNDTNRPSYVQSQVVHLGEDKMTFLAMAQGMCQIHNCMGTKRCRNVCLTSAETKNFSLYDVAGKRRCIYVRQKCLESICIFPHTSLRYESSHLKMSYEMCLARSMLRMGGVHYPFDPLAIDKATNNWGKDLTGEPAVVPPAGDCHRRRQMRPHRVILRKHPCVEDYMSLQGMLQLTDAQMQRCLEDTKHKLDQEASRKAKLEQIRIQELVEDFDYHVKTSPKFPVNSLSELRDACPGMAEAIHLFILRDTGSRHALDIPSVRNGIRTVHFFLSSMTRYQKKKNRDGISSSEAYEFVSASHVHKYGYDFAVLSKWMWLGSWQLHLDIAQELGLNSPDRMQCVNMALRLFDELHADSLYLATCGTPCVPKWSFQCTTWGNLHPEVVDRSYEDYVNIRKAICHMVDKMAEEEQEEGVAKIEVPLIPMRYSYDDYKTIMSTRLTHEKAAAAQHKCLFFTWIKMCFRILAARPETRCAALDILGINTKVLVDMFLQEV